MEASPHESYEVPPHKGYKVVTVVDGLLLELLLELLLVEEDEEDMELVFSMVKTSNRLVDKLTLLL